MEHTELENKLFEYIQFLIYVMNLHNDGLDYLYKAYNTFALNVGKELKTLDYTNKLDEISATLNEQFNWNSTVVNLNNKESND